MARHDKTIINLRQLGNSKEPAVPGAVFDFLAIDQKLRCGLVVKTGLRFHAAPFGEDGTILVYLYRTPYSMSTDCLSAENLLTPPLVTYNGLWESGLFRTTRILRPESLSVLPFHQFWNSRKKQFFDENGAAVRRRPGPIGLDSVFLEGGVSSAVSIALGLKYHADDAPDPIPHSLENFWVIR
jgi:hypothetical protein